MFDAFGLDPAEETPGRLVVRHIGESLVKAMEMALADAPPEEQKHVKTAIGASRAQQARTDMT